jgi:hypothetical protein
MFKKEFYDALKKLLECLLVLLAIPLAIVWDKFVVHFGWSFLDIFKFVFAVTVVVYSPYSGATIFQSEKKDRAFEYLLSLPLPRLKIILYKVAPRITFLLLLLVVSAFFSVFANIWTAGLILVVLFLISLFLSIVLSSVIVGLIEVALLYVLIHLNDLIINVFLWKLKIAGDIFPSFPTRLFSAAFVLIPLGIAFWLTFKNLDVKPFKLQMRPYLFIAFPSILILITFAAVFFKRYLAWAQEF